MIRHKSYAPGRLTPDEAAADAELLDYDFHLFTEKSTGQDSVFFVNAETGRGNVIYRRYDGHYGLITPVT